MATNDETSSVVTNRTSFLLDDDPPSELFASNSKEKEPKEKTSKEKSKEKERLKSPDRKKKKRKEKEREKDREKKEVSSLIQKFVEDLLRLDIKCLADIRDQIFLKEGSEEFIELISVFYIHHGKIMEFAEWAIQHEVEQTKDHLVLFREDSFTITLINTILFGDLGRKYLSLLITPLIENIVSVGAVLEINEEKVGREKAEQNIKLLFKFLDQFLDTFKESPHLCPIALRELFLIIKKTVEAKFGSKFDTPFILDFIFFKYICPAIIDPKKYELAEELPSFTQRGLILASKLLNDIAHNIPKNRGGDIEDMWDNYITTKHPFLASAHGTLVDPQNIETVKAIIKGSVLIDESWLQEQRQVSAQKVKNFLGTLPQFTSSYRESIYKNDSKEMYQTKCKEFLEKLNDPAWRKSKQTKEWTMYSIKDKDTMLLKAKAECTVEAPAMTVFDFLKDFSTERKINSMISDYTVSPTSSMNDDYQELTMYLKMPFPLNNRDMVISKRHYEFHKHEEEEEDVLVSRHEKHKFCSAAVIYESVPAPRNKGYVRGTMHVCGWYFEPLSSKSCRVTVMLHQDPGGSIPLWVINYMSVTQTEKLLALKRMFEPQKLKLSKHKKKSASMNDLSQIMAR